MGDTVAVPTVPTEAPPVATVTESPSTEPPTTEPPATVTTDRFGDWRDQLHTEIRGHDAFKEMKGPDELAHAYLDKLDGYYRLPGEQAADEEVDKFFEDIGVPGEITEYENELKDMEYPENVDVDKEFVSGALNEAFELHIYPFQIKGLLNWYYERMSGRFKDVETQNLKTASDSDDQMKREWGADYRKNSAVVERALTALGGDDIIDWAEDAGVANDPVFMRLIYNIGKNLTEDMVLQGVPVSGGGSKEKQTHLSYPNTPEHGAL